uniref:Uncharacterized protein n=1 Tax=Plectus sambesii TaxID=2011161 RepID=A0A914UN36_9BILA
MSLRDCTAFSARVLGLLIALYFFICSLDLLSDAFRLVGGKTAGQVLGNNKLLTNPVAGLMIGELATVLLQSSSATTSILVSMVAGDLLSVHNAIPIVMGANIGTSMTNTLVSLGHSVDRAQFERAFAGATVHDMFNYLSVTCLLPIEVAFGLIERCTGLIVADINGMSKGADLQLLNVLTDPLTRRIIEVNKNKIAEIAENTALQSNVTIKYDSLIKKCNNQEYNLDPCGYRHIFAYSTWSDLTIGLILLLVSIAALIACLIAIVKLLHSMLNGPMLAVIQKAVNTDLPGRCGYFTGYIAIAIGCGMTFL